MALKVSYGLLVAALVVALLGGFTSGSILGGLLALGAIGPAGYAAWEGTQKESQAPMVKAVVAIILGLGLAAVLIVLRIIDWVR